VVSDDGDVDVRRVTNDDLKAFFEHIAIKRKSVRRDGILSEPEDKVNGKYVLNSASYVEGYRSALKWHYESCGVAVPEEVLKDLSRFTSGFKRVKAKRKQDGEEDGDEGKAPMLFTAYEWLANQAMRATTDISAARFAWPFLLFAWNLITRSVNVGGLMFDHISAIDDSLTVVMHVEKQDQKGKDTAPKHIFANPVRPWLCCVLALAVYVFTMGPRRPGAKMLVFGNDAAEGRFGDWLRKFLRLFQDSLLAMGVIISHIGTHSFRKGTATFLGGMVDGPSGIQIYLRAGWSLGLQKKYIHEGGGSDRLCGRAASGLTLDAEEFGCLPPHFNLHDGPPLSNEEWEVILPGFMEYPESFRVALPLLLASILYHWDFIKENFADSHPIHSSRLFTLPAERITQMRSRVYAGKFKNPTTGMVARGVYG
jgi:hypothetical protein